MKTVLAVDIGNSSASWGVFARGLESDQLMRAGKCPTQAVDQIAKVYAEVGATHLLVSSVVPQASYSLGQQVAIDYLLRHDTAQGLKIACKPPDCVGADRLANALGASSLGYSTALIVDMGTATTLDVLCRDTYEGGIIAPGIGAMTVDLHEKTALLPQLNTDRLPEEALIGTNTVQAMSVGITRGYPALIRVFVAQGIAFLKTKGLYKGFPLLLTGGAAHPWLRASLKELNFTEYLSLYGLCYGNRLATKIT